MTNRHGGCIVALCVCACFQFSSVAYADSLSHDDAVRMALERAPVLRAQSRRVDGAHEAKTNDENWKHAQAQSATMHPP